MSLSIKGVLSHQRLLELKNCGVVEPEIFEMEAEELFVQYRSIVAENLLKQNNRFLVRLFYGKKEAERDARWMFPDRRDLLEHLIYLEGISKYLSLTKEQLEGFTLIHQASVASSRAMKTLDCFKYSDQVIVDEDTGFNIDWLLKNAYILKQHLAANKAEE